MFPKRTNWELEENAYTRALRQTRGGKPILDLTASNPTTCGFRVRRSGDRRRAARPLRCATTRTKGCLRRGRPWQSITRTKRADVDPEQLILTTGTSEAYSFLFRLLCEPGDEVLIAHPSYPLFDFLADDSRREAAAVSDRLRPRMADRFSGLQEKSAREHARSCWCIPTIPPGISWRRGSRGTQRDLREARSGADRRRSVSRL